MAWPLGAKPNKTRSCGCWEPRGSLNFLEWSVFSLSSTLSEALFPSLAERPGITTKGLALLKISPDRACKIRLPGGRGGAPVLGCRTIFELFLELAREGLFAPNTAVSSCGAQPNQGAGPRPAEVAFASGACFFPNLPDRDLPSSWLKRVLGRMRVARLYDHKTPKKISFYPQKNPQNAGAFGVRICQTDVIKPAQGPQPCRLQLSKRIPP